MGNLSGISIEPFRGELEELQRLAQTAWKDEYGTASFPDLYRPQFIRYLLQKSKDPRHFIAAYKENELLAFLANIPRIVSYQQKKYRAILSCLLVSRREYLRKGLAQAVIEEALRINQEITRYDFALLYMETGHRSSFLLEKLKRGGHNIQFLKRLTVLGRILNLELVVFSEGLKTIERMAIKAWGAHRVPPAGGCDQKFQMEELKPEDLEEIQTLLNHYAETSDLALFWNDQKELESELYFPGVAETSVLKKDRQLAAVFSYFIHDHIGKSLERWAWLNHVAFKGLSPKEQKVAVNLLLHNLANRGIVGVVEWTKGYYPLGLLYRARFFPYPRSVNLYAWVFNPEIKFKHLRRIYEVQI